MKIKTLTLIDNIGTFSFVGIWTIISILATLNWDLVFIIPWLLLIQFGLNFKNFNLFKRK